MHDTPLSRGRIRPDCSAVFQSRIAHNYIGSRLIETANTKEFQVLRHPQKDILIK